MVLGEVIAGEHRVRALMASFPFLEVWLLGLRANFAIVQLRATPHHAHVGGDRRLPDSTVRSLHQGEPSSLGSHISCCFVTMPMLILTWTPTCRLMSQPGLGPPPSPQKCPVPWAMVAPSCLLAALLPGWGQVLADEAVFCLTQEQLMAPQPR